MDLESEFGVYGELMSRSMHKITPPAKRANNKDSTLHELLPEQPWAVMQPQASLLQLLTHAELRILPLRNVDQMLRHSAYQLAHAQAPGFNLCWTPIVAYAASYYSKSAVTLDDVMDKVFPPRKNAAEYLQFTL